MKAIKKTLTAAALACGALFVASAGAAETSAILVSTNLNTGEVVQSKSIHVSTDLNAVGELAVAASRIDSQIYAVISRCLALSINRQATSPFGPATGRAGEDHFAAMVWDAPDQLREASLDAVGKFSDFYQKLEATPQGLAFVRNDESACVNLRSGKIFK